MEYFGGLVIDYILTIMLSILFIFILTVAFLKATDVLYEHFNIKRRKSKQYFGIEAEERDDRDAINIVFGLIVMAFLSSFCFTVFRLYTHPHHIAILIGVVVLCLCLYMCEFFRNKVIAIGARQYQDLKKNDNKNEIATRNVSLARALVDLEKEIKQLKKQINTKKVNK